MIWCAIALSPQQYSWMAFGLLCSKHWKNIISGKWCYSYFSHPYCNAGRHLSNKEPQQIKPILCTSSAYYWEKKVFFLWLGWSVSVVILCGNIKSQPSFSTGCWQGNFMLATIFSCQETTTIRWSCSFVLGIWAVLDAVFCIQEVHSVDVIKDLA